MHVVQEYFPHLLGKRGLVDKCVDLEIMLEAAEVHIGGTDAGQFVVCHHQFRVKESRFIEIDLDARLYHFIDKEWVAMFAVRVSERLGSINRTSTPPKAAICKAWFNPSVGRK